MRTELLKYIQTQSAPLRTQQYPNGYCNLPAAQEAGATELQAEGFITAYLANKNAEGSFPVVLTEKGVNYAEPAPVPQTAPGNPAGTNVMQAAPFDPSKIRMETGIPMPTVRARGFQPSEGGNAVDRYGFANMEIGISFHLPPSGDPDKPIHRTFSSTVSQANKKLHPKNFIVREVTNTDPQGPGARVWRVADMDGPRPTRAKAAHAAAPQAAPQPAAAPSPGFGGGFPGMPPAPAPAPASAPPGFGGAPAPFAPPAGPQGFGEAPQGFPAGGPSFGG